MQHELQRLAAYLLLSAVEAEKIVDEAREDYDSDVYRRAQELRTQLLKATALLEYITTQTEG